MKADLLFWDVITIRGRSGSSSILPVLRLLRSVSSRDQPPPFLALEDFTANLDKSKGRLNPTIKSPLFTARQKIRRINEFRSTSVNLICGGNRRVSGTLAGLSTYL